MYIWMILATFMVMLAAFNLSPRADIEKQQQAPLAEAAVTKFLVQHNAAVECATEALKKMLNNVSQEVVNVDGATNLLEAGPDYLAPYLPLGYNYTEGAYYSKVYCLKGNEMDSEGNITAKAGRIPINCREGVRYVITFGRVPQRWKNVSTNKILAPYYTALRTKIPMQSTGGVVIPKIEGDRHNLMDSDYIIQTMGLIQRYNSMGDNTGDNRIQTFSVSDDSIPPYFLQNDEDFNSKCMLQTEEGLDPRFPCVIYISKVEL